MAIVKDAASGSSDDRASVSAATQQQHRDVPSEAPSASLQRQTEATSSSESDENQVQVDDSDIINIMNGSMSSMAKRTRSKSRTRPAGSKSTGTEGATRAVRGTVNRTYLLAYVDFFRSEEFRTHFNIRTFERVTLNRWIHDNGNSFEAGSSTGRNHPARILYEESEKKIQRHAEKKERDDEAASTMAAEPRKRKNDKTPSSVIEVLETEQIKQVFRAARTVATYGAQDNRIFELFDLIIVEKERSPKFIVGTMYLPRILISNPPKNIISLSKASKIEALLFFHCISVYHSTPKSGNSNVMGNRVGYALQKIVDCWRRLVSNCHAEEFGPISRFIMPYVTFNYETAQFSALNSRTEGFGRSSNERTLLDQHATQAQEEVDTVAWNRSTEVDGAVRYIINMMFSHLNKLINRDYLYDAKDEDLLKWAEIQKYNLPPNVLCGPQVFEDLPDTVAHALQFTKPDKIVPRSDDFIIVEQVQSGSDNDDGQRTTRKRGNNDDEDDSGEPKRARLEDAVTEVKEEPLTTDIKVSRSAQMDDPTKAAYEQLPEIWQKKFLFLDGFLQDVVQLSVEAGGFDIENQVQLVLTDPPYNTRREGNQENSSHDSFSDRDMEDLIEICVKVMKPGAHGVIFCSFQQFEMWRKIIMSHSTQILDYDADPTGNTYKTETIFHAEPTPLVFVKQQGKFGNTSRNELSHVNMTEFAIHFWKKSTDVASMKRNVNYKALPSYPSVHPGWTNVQTEVPVPEGDEVMYDIDASTGTKVKLRPEQKSIKLLQYLISKFTKGGDVVLDFCAGTFSCLKACMTMPEHRRFVGIEVDTTCHDAVEYSITELFAEQLQLSTSDITPSLFRTESEQVREQGTIVRKYVLESHKREKLSAWEVPDGLISLQNFPPHVVQCLCQYYNNFSLYAKRHLTIRSWEPQEIKWLNSLDVKHVRAYEANCLGISIRKSSIQHPKVGLGVYTNKPISSGETVGFYYGTLVYGNLATKHRLHRRYGMGVLSVTADDFEKWAAKISGKQFTDAESRKYDGYICPAPFCTMRYINDPRYLPGGNETKPKKNPRTANVEFAVDPRTRYNRDFEQYYAVGIVAKRDIAVNQELFMEYGDDYNFQ